MFLMRTLTILVVGALFGGGVWAQTLSFGTGSADMELSLNEMNIQAKADLQAFSAELSVEFGIPELRIRSYVEDRRLEPAEVYLVLEIADIAGVEPEVVADERRKDKPGGWGAIARELGIKPGSPEFHELKRRTTGKDVGGGKPGR